MVYVIESDAHTIMHIHSTTFKSSQKEANRKWIKKREKEAEKMEWNKENKEFTHEDHMNVLRVVGQQQTISSTMYSIE